MDIPFSYRVVVLLGLMALVAGIDRYRRGAESIKHLEYMFILFSGIIGCTVGGVNDFVTSGISPDYFILGKGLSAENVRVEAVLLGAKSGFSAGVIGGAICLFSLGKKRPEFGLMYRLLALPVVCAVIAGVTATACLGGLDPANLSAQVSGLVGADQMARFLRVWWIHTGLYAGLALGLAGMVVLVRRRTRRKDEG